MGVKTKDRDLGAARIRANMRLVDNSYVTIGVHDDAGNYPTGVPVPAVAAWNEFGTNTIPSRPFLRSAIDVNRRTLQIMHLNFISRLIEGKTTVRQGLESVGFVIQSMIQARIEKSNQWAEPNAPSTAASKASGGGIRGATPLIKTKLLFRSIGYKVNLVRSGRVPK